MSVSSGDDHFDVGPAPHGSRAAPMPGSAPGHFTHSAQACARESSMRAVHQARAALARNDSPSDEAVVGQLRESAKGRGRRFDRGPYGNAETTAGEATAATARRERSRRRAASMEAAQEMSTRAIGRFQEHIRAQQAHAAAAEALVQGTAPSRTEEIARAPLAVEAQDVGYTVYDNDEYYRQIG